MNVTKIEREVVPASRRKIFFVMWRNRSFSNDINRCVLGGSKSCLLIFWNALYSALSPHSKTHGGKAWSLGGSDQGSLPKWDLGRRRITRVLTSWRNWSTGGFIVEWVSRRWGTGGGIKSRSRVAFLGCGFQHDFPPGSQLTMDSFDTMSQNKCFSM